MRIRFRRDQRGAFVPGSTLWAGYRFRGLPLVAALATAGCSHRAEPARVDVAPVASRHAPLQHRLQAKLDSIRGAGHFPGATLGVALADGGVLALATGLSDTARKIPMRPDHLLLEGSVGKTYVAAVALQLVHERTLDLDAKIERYLGTEPWFARLPNARDITVRQLMGHTSGLVRYEFKEEFTRDLTANPTKAWRPAEEIAYILDSSPPFPAGQGWEYSDTNYIVLGMIIERLTGKPYYETLRARILGPFALAGTVPSDRQLIPGLSQGYAGPDNPFGGRDAMLDERGLMSINPQFEWTGGGIASTASDLARWGKLLYEGSGFDRSLLREVLAGVPAPMLGPNVRYGLGVIIRETRLGAAWGHSGFFPGYLTEMLYFPDRHFAIAIQFNDSAPRAIGRAPVGILVDLAALVADE